MWRSTIAKQFIDTNILIYAVNSASPKQAPARELLRGLRRKGNGVISTQVMQEFYQNATRKLQIEAAAAADLTRHLRRFEVVPVTPDLIEDAMKLHSAGQTSFWDSLIVCAASFAGCSTLWSEDLSHGQAVLGVRVVNPLE